MSGEKDIMEKIRDRGLYVWRGMKYVTRVSWKTAKG